LFFDGEDEDDGPPLLVLDGDVGVLRLAAESAVVSIGSLNLS
jgi:hypothetical protein